MLPAWGAVATVHCATLKVQGPILGYFQETVQGNGTLINEHLMKQQAFGQWSQDRKSRKTLGEGHRDSFAVWKKHKQQ